jgi:hypothetical protein
MRRVSVRGRDAKSLLPSGIRDIPFKGRIADCLGLFGLLVMVLGLTCLLGGDPISVPDSGRGSMSVQESRDLQLLFFFLLGIGQLLFLRKKLPVLLSKKVRLFSREGWYYIGVLGALLLVLLFLLYLFIDSSHLSMAGVSLCAFLMPFTLFNAWEIFRESRGQGAGQTSAPGPNPESGTLRIPESGTLMIREPGMLMIPESGTLMIPEPLAERSVGRAAMYGKAGLVLDEYASRLLALDARFSRLVRKDTVTSPADVARVRDEIKAQEYALGDLLDSLDSGGSELSPLTTAFRSLLDGHRILSRLPNDREQQDYAGKPQPDSVREGTSLV